MFCRYFEFDSLIKGRGELEVDDVEVIDEDTARLKLLNEMGADGVADFLAARDQFFCGVFGGCRLNGFLEGWVDQANIIVDADLLIDVGNAGRVDMVVQRDLALDGLQVLGSGGGDDFFFLDFDVHDLDAVSKRNTDIKAFVKHFSGHSAPA